MGRKLLEVLKDRYKDRTGGYTRIVKSRIPCWRCCRNGSNQPRLNVMKTFHPKLADAKVSRKWFVIDAEGQILGKIATRVADVLRGRHKATWHPSIDCGDNVIYPQCKKVVLTGQKETKKSIFATQDSLVVSNEFLFSVCVKSTQNVCLKKLSLECSLKPSTTTLYGKTTRILWCRASSCRTRPQPLTLR